MNKYLSNMILINLKRPMFSFFAFFLFKQSTPLDFKILFILCYNTYG